MKKAWSDVKSFVTVLMTIAMVILLFAPIEVNKEVLTIFSATYCSVMTYFFTKKKTDGPDSDDISDNTQE